MALLVNHLDQINASAQAIGELEFPVSRPFTNALLQNQEITALIRDTEPHERGLFSVNPKLSIESHHHHASARRKTTHAPSQGQSSAVARVLGNDMLHRIRASNRDSSRGRAVDIEVLLQSAEKLCHAYAVPGAMERIAALRMRHEQISASIKRFEDQVAKQQLSMNRFHSGLQETGDSAHDEGLPVTEQGRAITEDDLRMEDQAVKELEAKKRALEATVAGMEKDLGGLLR